MMQVEGKRVLVIGLGVSGRAAVELLLANGALVAGADRSLSSPEIPRLRKQGLVAFEETQLPSLEPFDLCVISPGINPDHPLILEARRRNLEVIGEIELAFRFAKGRAIGITGTNGKTTVTLMVAHVLRAAGRNARAVGNVGTPLSLELLRSNSPDQILVVELSSFQLETLQTRCLDSAVILNITPDHLDRYPSMLEYAEAKLRIGSCLKKGRALLVGETCAIQCAQQLARIPHYAVGFGPSATIRISSDQILVNEKIETILPLGYRGRRDHDVTNWLVAYTLCRQAGISPDDFQKGMATFQKPPHRMEFVDEIDGVAWYNDSKGTNIDAVVQGVQSLERPIILIAGGKNKGSTFGAWSQSFKGRVRALCAIGEAAEEIGKELKGRVPVRVLGDMKEAVEYARQLAEKGDAVLLSPGCASFDQFKDFEHRGTVFKGLVSELCTNPK